MKLFFPGLLAVALLTSSCKDASTARDVARDVLTAGEIICVLAHGDAQPEEVAAICAIDKALLRVIGDTLTAHKLGVGVPRPPGCPR